MTREELYKSVKEALGSTQLKLSERTINEELDDVLEDFGDNEEANSKLITKVANRLKRMDGNLHADVSKEIKASKEEAERKRKEKEEEEARKSKSKKDEDDVPQYVKDLQAELTELKNARKQEQAERAKHAVMESVKNGLKEKFESAGLKLNGFFAKSALSKLEIPEEGADVATLVAEAERLYNADIKEADVNIDKPHNGSDTGTKKEDEHEWDDVAKIVNRNRPKAE
jgi:hypothetical protein